MNLIVTEQQAIRLERGFKTWSENTATSIRDRIGIRRVDPLPPEQLAEYLGVRLWRLADVPGLPQESLAYLSSAKGDEWSAVTVRIGQIDVIVMNDTHSSARRASDIMHELAHLIRRHEPSRVFVSETMGIWIRTFDPTQEAEANWLAGCLLLPRAALSHCGMRQMERSVICERYGVSEELARYRINVTGIGKQYGIG